MSRQTHLAKALLASGMLWSTCSSASDSWNVQGEHGVLEINGSLMEAPCLLDMRSEFQDVAMDSSALANLRHPGDTGQPVTLTFRLMGCFAARVSDKAMPMISFLSAADADEPTLLKMGGVSGVGLRILNDQGRQIAPGERYQPHFTTAGGNTMVYQVIPVRTVAPLTTGRFKATVDFRMSYE